MDKNIIFIIINYYFIYFYNSVQHFSLVERNAAVARKVKFQIHCSRKNVFQTE